MNWFGKGFGMGGVAAEANIVSPEEIWRLIQEGSLIVDVRSSREYASGTIPGSIHVPHDEVELRLAEFGETRERVIVVYCGAGVRAQVAIEVLTQNGYANVYNGGGYKDLCAYGFAQGLMK